MNLEALCLDPFPLMPAWLAEFDRNIVRAPGRTSLAFGLVTADLTVDRGVRSWMFEEDTNYRKEAKRLVALARAEGVPVTVRELVARVTQETRWNLRILSEYVDSELT